MLESLRGIFDYRFVVIRPPAPEERSGQGTPFRLGQYACQVLLTILALDRLNLWRFDNAGVRVVLIIHAFRGDHWVRKIPSRDFCSQGGRFHFVVIREQFVNRFNGRYLAAGV
jgi:hypothetical protein